MNLGTRTKSRIIAQITNSAESPVPIPNAEMRNPPASGPNTVPAPTVSEYKPIVDPRPVTGETSASSASAAGVKASMPTPNIATNTANPSRSNSLNVRAEASVSTTPSKEISPIRMIFALPNLSERLPKLDCVNPSKTEPTSKRSISRIPTLKANPGRNEFCPATKNWKAEGRSADASSRVKVNPTPIIVIRTNQTGIRANMGLLEVMERQFSRIETDCVRLDFVSFKIKALIIAPITATMAPA